MRETQELVTIIPWTFIAQICNLFIQCWLIKKFLFKPVCAIIEKRRALADSQIQDAKKAKEEADAMKADYEAEMAKAKETANSILQNAQKDAAARSEAMIQEAQTQAAGIKAKAEADMPRRRRKQLMTLKMRSVALPWIIVALGSRSQSSMQRFSSTSIILTCIPSSRSWLPR